MPAYPCEIRERVMGPHVHFDMSCAGADARPILVTGLFYPQRGSKTFQAVDDFIVWDKGRQVQAALQETWRSTCNKTRSNVITTEDPLNFSPSETVYVKTTRGEPVSWQEDTVEQVFSPVTYMIRVQGKLQFTHVDHLRPRKTSLWTEVPSNAACATSSQNDGGIRPGGSRVPKSLLQESSSRGAFSKRNVSSEPWSRRQDPTPTTSSELRDSNNKTPQVLPREPPLDPSSVTERGNPGLNKTVSSSAAVEQPIPTGNESSSALPRRGTFVRNPPERYAAEDFTKRASGNSNDCCFNKKNCDVNEL
ncbi:hypothetical protein HPB50_028917 [Hyalomma asiaticum]|nr:hypothetical protein HPB50_028917 [Hyalomma asiaticum]